MTIPSWRDRGGRGVVWAAFFMMLALGYAAIAFLWPDNFLVVGWDYQCHQFFLKTFLADSLRAGELPLWTPYIAAGRPFAADPQSGVFYPPNLLYAVLSVPQAVTVLVVLHMAAAGYFCFLLARELKMTSFASVLSGVVFMFNGFLMTRAYRGQSERLEALAYLPLVFFLLERGERRGQLRWFCWAGLAGALQMLAGAPQIAWLTWVGAGVYVVIRRLSCWRAGGARALASSMMGLLLAVVFTAGLAAVQILPTAELVELSNRSEGSIEFSSAFAFAPQRLIHFVYPNYCLDRYINYFNCHAESTGYVGVLTLILAVLGLLHHSNRAKWALLGVILLNIFIMLGRATPAFSILYHVLPGFSGFRIPARAIVMLTLGLSLLAGLGVDAVWHQERSTRTRRLGAIMASVLLLVMITTGRELGRFSEGGIAGMRPLWSGLMLGTLAAAAMIVVWRTARPWLQVFCLILIITDLTLVAATADKYRHSEPRSHAPPASEDQIVEQLRGDSGLYRFALPRSMVRENCGVLAKRSGVNAFISLSLERYYNFVHYMTWQRRPPLVTHTPAADVFGPDDSFPFKILNVRYGVGRDPQTGEECLVERDDYLPRAFFVSRWRVLDTEEAVLEAIRRADFDPRGEVLFDQDPGVDFAPSEGEGQVAVTTYSPKRIVLKADVTSDGFLVLSEMHYPGWCAYVDGEEVPILRADYLLRAIPLRAGRHAHIEFRYEPRSITVGLSISLAMLVVLVIVLLTASRRSHRPETSSAGEEVPHSQGRKTEQVFFAVQAAVIVIAGLSVPWLLKPHYAACWAQVAHYLTQEGDHEQAAVARQRALGMAPDSYFVNFLIGKAYMKEGKNLEAAERLLAAMREMPDEPETYNTLGVVMVVTNDLDQGLQYLKRSLELDPEQSAAYKNLGIALIRGGRYDEAAGHMNRVLEITPGDPDLHLEIAALWAAHGQYARSADVLRQGLARRPNNPSLLDALARQLAACPQKELRDGSRAVRLAERACRETAHQNPRILLTLAMACLEADERDHAKSVARQARSLAVSQGESVLLLEIDVFLQSISGNDSRR